MTEYEKSVRKSFLKNFKDDKRISVWEFDSAPEILSKLALDQDDKDWLFLVPPIFKNEYIDIIHNYEYVEDYEFVDGWTVFIIGH